MAKEKADKELEIENSAEESESENSGTSRSRLRLMLIALVVLTVGGGSAYWFLLRSPATSPDELEQVAEVEESSESIEYLEIDPPFIVNFPDRGRQRFVQATIALMTRDPAMPFALEQNMPIIRHKLTMILSAQSLAVLQSPDGIESIRLQAAQELRELLDQEVGKDAIEEVLFTSFVMQ